MGHKLKTVIIGGSSGMGLAIAKMLHALGHEIVIASRSKEKLEKAVKTIGKAEDYVVDVTKEKEVIQFFDAVGAFDHLVTSAASFVMGPFLNMPLNDAKHFFDSKFWGQYMAAKIGAPHQRRGGSITFFCGIAGQRPFMNFAAGSAINAAIEGLTRALALELSPLRVNAIAPGTVVTPVWNEVPEKERLTAFEETAQRLPAKRVGQPEDIAEAARYLIQCGYATGSIVYVDGGARIV
ncbi:MAG TPA: SDR family oxidoreductase [Chlamydiales bacterium]|nr:SDR family oxidoreductase [Chlamydiales bacterium]